MAGWTQKRCGVTLGFMQHARNKLGAISGICATLLKKGIPEHLFSESMLILTLGSTAFDCANEHLPELRPDPG